jgi:hypothetical protein
VTAQVKTLQAELKNDVEDNNPCKAKPKPVVVEKPIVQAPPPPPPPPPPSHKLEYAGGGIAAAGAIVFGIGVYYGLQAKDLSDKITNHPAGTPWPENIKQMESDGESDQSKQIVFMVGGGVLIAGGVVLAIYGHSHSASSEHVSVVPVASPTSLGFVLGRRF